MTSIETRNTFGIPVSLKTRVPRQEPGIQSLTRKEGCAQNVE